LRENSNSGNTETTIQQKRTRRKYETAKKEWRNWCATEAFKDANTVSEEKLCLFLNAEVIGRESRARGYAARRKRKLADRRLRLERGEKRRKTQAHQEFLGDSNTDTDTDEHDTDSVPNGVDDNDNDHHHHTDTDTDTDADEDTLFKETVGFSVAESYVNGITELWKEQRRDHANPHAVLRGTELADLMEVVKRSDRDRRRAECADKALFNAIDGYDSLKMMEGISWCWREGSQARNGPEPYLRTAADFLIGHFMVLRGESRRLAQLPDLVTLPLPNEGPTPCDALILIMGNGKASKHGNIEYMGALRHKDVLLCPLSALGFYFFWRWGHHSKLPAQPWRCLPSFYRPDNYYDLRAFPGDIKYPDREWAPEGQRDWIDRLFVGAGIQSFRKTYKQSVRHAEVEGVEKAQIRKAGRWRNDAMLDYLASLPRDFMRKVAGFGEGESFFLPRASVEPPPELTRLVWPEVEE
jgi:hypothetical protein